MKNDKFKLAFLIFVLTLIDQIAKYFMIIKKDIMPIDVIKNMIQLNYVENYGIAFGMARGSRSIFIIASIIIIGIIIKFLFTQSRSLNRTKKILIAVIISGGIGNLIDRIFRGFVMDYIDITKVINYPVFNLADIMIVIGVIVFAIYIIKDIITENNEKENKV